MMSGARNFPFRPALRFPPGKRPTLFGTNYIAAIRPSPGAKSILDDPSHPRHYKLMRSYEARDPKSLWLAPMVSLTTSPKRTVRVWCVRRLRAALREEMAARGLNELGQRMVDGKATKGPAVVWGTLTMHVTHKMISARYEKVREEAGWTADALLAGIRPQGSSPAPKPTPNDWRGGKQFAKGGGTASKSWSPPRGRPPPARR